MPTGNLCPGVLVLVLLLILCRACDPRTSLLAYLNCSRNTDSPVRLFQLDTDYVKRANIISLLIDSFQFHDTCRATRANQKKRKVPFYSYCRHSSHSDNHFNAQIMFTHKQDSPLSNWISHLIIWGCGFIMGFATFLIPRHVTGDAVPAMREVNMPGTCPRGTHTKPLSPHSCC